jgi:3-phosphoshikimate 1-carboxyvinyltransferase
MLNLRVINSISHLNGKPTIPGDKSISHRALLLGALAEGKTSIEGILESEDVLSTWKCLESLGVTIRRNGKSVLVDGTGLHGLSEPKTELNCGNSGTSLRLLMGILAGCPFSTRLIGDTSLSRRPMERISLPLTLMGAKIDLSPGGFAPITLRGQENLKPIHYDLPIASAQLKSAILLAGLFAEGKTILTGKIHSRDHTERLLPHFGVKLETRADQISLEGGQKLYGTDVCVPGDLSSAAFWLVAATLVPQAQIEIENVSLNPSRLGLLNVMKRMGAQIVVESTQLNPEPIGRIHVRSSVLQATLIHSSEIPSLIDEIPLIAVLASQAHGTTEIRGAEELRVKETDRIQAVAQNLRVMGIEVETFPDGLSVSGPQVIRGGKIDSYGDHRIAMAFSIAALRATGPTELSGSACVAISYPTFYETLSKLSGGLASG